MIRARLAARTLAVVTSLMLAGCGSGAPVPKASQADCARADAEGVVLVSVTGLRFDVSCIILAPAGADFTIRLTNHDSPPHDIAIYDNPSKSTKLFEGETFSGPGATKDYAIPPLAAGQYYFDCIVHPPDMHGTLFVEAAVASPGG